MTNFPIGIFDSGVGGLTVLREVRRLLPAHNIIYVADQAHVPYGSRPLEEVRRFAFGITDFLLGQGAQIIVVACNAASAAALKSLRESYPQVPFVGMEPAVKPAAEETRRGVIGVLATPATFEGELFASAVDRYAKGVRVVTQTMPGLVERIEAGDVDSPALEADLRRELAPLLAEGIDELVLGCTHYPFVKPLLEKIAGPRVRVIDPAPAVARQVVRVLAERGTHGAPAAGGPPSGGMPPRGGMRGETVYYTSGSPERFSQVVRLLLGEEAAARAAGWHEGRLMAAV